MGLIALVLVAACRPATPDLRALAASMRAYEEGKEALAAGDAPSAVRAFSLARSTRPDDPLLTQWHARALRRAGDAASAERMLIALVGEAPTLMTARYDLGILKLDRGEASGADDVRAAVEAGVVSPAEASRDPDLALHRSLLGFLPAVPLGLTVHVDGASTRVGAEVVVRADVTGVLADPWSLTVVGGTGPVAVVMASEVVEDDGETHRLAWVLRASAPGTVSLPAMLVRQGSAAVQAPGGSFEVGAAAHVPEAAPLGGTKSEIVLPVPSHTTLPALPSVASGDGAWFVAWAADTRLVVEPASTVPTLRTSLRSVDADGTVLRAEERAWFAQAPQRVTVLRGALVEGQWPEASTLR